MKKSQILAALALAFALGVVAPVAGTYAEEGIMPLVDTGTTTEKSATNDNLKSAVNYVTSNETYKAFAKLAEAKKAAYDDKGDLKVKDVTAANGALTTALTGFDGASTTAGDTIVALNANIANLRTAVGTDYTKYVALYEAVNADDGKIGSTAAMNGVKGAMEALGYTFNIEDTDTFTTVKAAAETAINNKLGAGSYAKYTGAVKAIADAEATRDAFNGLQGALKNENLGLTKAQLKTVNEANSIATLDGVAPADATDWANVAKKITAIETAIKNENGTTNAARYALLDDENADAQGLKGLLQLMQVATDNEDLTYAQLISAAPIINNPDEPGTDQPGTETPGDDTKDPSAPGTGLVGTAEGNAATTVSIVAGLATALTALGAGVVAYRSARRSNK